MRYTVPPEEGRGLYFHGSGLVCTKGKAQHGHLAHQEHAGHKSVTPAFLYEGNVIDQVDEFKYLGNLTHGTKGLSPALELLCKAAKRAMFGLQRRCQQLNIQDPVLKCKLFDTLVRPILCYCCEVWSVLGSKSDLKDLERVELGFLETLLGVQTSTSAYMSMQSLEGTLCILSGNHRLPST